MYLLSAVWIPVVSSYVFRPVFKLRDAEDETIPLWHGRFYAFMGGDEWKIPADTAVPGKTGAFLCVYHSDSAACPAAGRAGRGKYGQKL